MSPYNNNLKYSDITSKVDFLNRRQLIAGASAVGIFSSLSKSVQADILKYKKTEYKVDAEVTSKSDATSFNNFYEFGTGKNDPKNNSSMMKIKAFLI